MDHIKVTIFTPTYNRCKNLLRLYESLEGQTRKDFHWIVVDDGSTDSTEEFFSSLQCSFDLSYIKKENGGKHTSYNIGIKQAKGEWFLCVDSDDYLTPDAVEKVILSINSIDNKMIGGVIFPQILNGEYDIQKWKCLEGKNVDIIDMKELYGIRETAIVIETKRLQQFMFPIFTHDGVAEKFCPEGVLYNKFVGKFKFVIKNDPIYISSYQESGITKNIWENWKRNYIGVIYSLKLRYEVLAKYPIIKRIIARIKCIINLNSLCIGCNRKVLAESPSVAYSILTYLPCRYYARKRYR